MENSKDNNVQEKVTVSKQDKTILFWIGLVALLFVMIQLNSLIKDEPDWKKYDYNSRSEYHSDMERIGNKYKTYNGMMDNIENYGN